MNPYIRALRAITATVFQRVYRPFAWVIGGIFLIMYLLIIWLALAVSPWWWIGLAVLAPLTIIVGVVMFVLWTLSNRLQPRRLQKHERQSIQRFTDRILRVAEVRATPVPILVALIAKDVIRDKKSTFIEETINDTTGLKQDFAAIRDLFI